MLAKKTELVSYEEVAKATGWSLRTIGRYVADGELRAHEAPRGGRQRRGFVVEELREDLAKLGWVWDA